ncbi:MAG: hypothetical protein ACKV22_06810 [Bryobacteraceae bacterium]
MRRFVFACTLLPIAAALANGPVEIARGNGRQASEAMERSRRVMHAWLKLADPVTSLLPRTTTNPAWVVRDSGADLYPFMVLIAAYTEPELLDSAMMHILRQETLLTTRVGRLSDDVLPGGKGWVRPDVQMDEILFGSSEYVKDGLITITELLGETPWYHRMRGISTDLVKYAPYRWGERKIPAQSAEVNGNVLQSLARLYWKTSDEAYLRQLIDLADLYFLEILPKTGYIPPMLWDTSAGKPLRARFGFSDHGNEIVGGLAETYLLFLAKRPDKAKQYREAFVRMMDRLLEVGRNGDGVWYMTYDIDQGKITDARHAHCWGYLFNPVYVAYLATGDEKYRQAVRHAIDGVVKDPRYLFDETGAGRKWGANAYSDSLESALVLLNRVPHPAMEAAIDEAMKHYWARQKEDGRVEDWYGDGNYIRTAMMYAFWKTQGASLTPWQERVHLGAVRESGGLLVHLSADAPWQGRLRFDHARHRDHWNMTRNYPRLNEFPEWFTVDQDRAYHLQMGGSPRKRYLGADLIRGIPLAVDGGDALIIKVSDAGDPPYGK